MGSSSYNGLEESIGLDDAETKDSLVVGVGGSDNMDFEKEYTKRSFYERYIKPNMEKGFLSNLFSFVIMIIGIIWQIANPKSIFGQFVLSFGLFAFSGGFTNWLAIKMLFDKVPGLYGSGVIPMRFKEIRETVKNVIMRTFFDVEYLQNYFKTKSAQWIGNLNLDQKLKEVLESPLVDKVLEQKLAELGTRPEGMMFAMMGINPVSLKPMIKPFVVGMGTELLPQLTQNFDPSQLIKIETLRDELDQLMTTKLLELTPQRVKKLMEDVMREHLGWLIVWGNVFGGLIGIASKTVEILAGA